MLDASEAGWRLGTADVPRRRRRDMNTNTDAIDAMLTARNALLVALVALGGVPTAEVPSDALDAALGLDESYYVKARARFRELHERLRGHRDFFEFEAATNEMVTTAVDVGFRVGTSTARPPCR
jgi:hypothetical protein